MTDADKSREEQESGREKEAGSQKFDRQRADADYQRLRPAGPRDMRDPPEGQWDIVDEGSDESFPASDPPSYMAGTGLAAPPTAEGNGRTPVKQDASNRKTEDTVQDTLSGEREQTESSKRDQERR